MKTDQIVIRSDGSGFEEALQQVEKLAVYNGLSHKQTLRLRLLAEEMTGMLRTIVGDCASKFWIETKGEQYSLHLATKTRMSEDLREELLKTSTSGENEAAKGFMGMLRDIYFRMTEPVDNNLPPMYEYGTMHSDTSSFEAPVGVRMHMAMATWSLQTYRDSVEQNREAAEEAWDELEKSITAKLADEIRIFINGDSVEMVIDKKLPKER